MLTECVSQIVITPSTYPNFSRFLELQASAGVQLVPTEMTLSVTRDNGLFEWAGDSLRTIFCQTRRILDPDMYRLLYDIFRFNVSARALVYTWRDQANDSEDDSVGDLSIGQYFTREGYSDSFANNYFIVSARTLSGPTDAEAAT